MIRKPRIHRALVAAIAAILMLAPLTSCASSGRGSDMTGLAGPSVGFDSSGVATDSSAESGVADFAPQGPELGKSIVYTGDVSIRVSDPAESARDVARVADDLGGYVESTTVSEAVDGNPGGASLAVRVPADKVSEAFVELSKIGTVLAQSQSADDVTLQHVDLQARVKALQGSVDRLTELMAGAATTSELIEAESALAQRQQELDGLSAQLESLEDQVKHASIWVSLSTQSAIPGGPGNFWDGLIAGLESLAAAGAGALVVLGILIPWLVLAGIVTFAIVLIVKTRRRRRTKRTMETPGS